MHTQYRASRWRPLAIILLFCAAVLPEQARGNDICNRETPKGAPVSPFFGLDMAIWLYALAEKHCGAPSGSMASKFLGFVMRKGCGPGTPVYSAVQDWITALDGADLAGIFEVGGEGKLTPEQVQERMKRLALEGATCENLLRAHNSELE